MQFLILAALLAVSAASYNNNKAPVNFGSLAYSNRATSEPNYHTSVNSVNSEPVYSTPATPVLTYSAQKADKVSPVSAAYAFQTAKAYANEDEEEHDEEDEDDDDEETESKNESESSDGKKIKDSGDRNVYATSTVGGGEYEHTTTASTHVITSAYKEPEYSTTSIPVVVVSTPAYQIPPTTAVPVYVAEKKILPYWLRPGYT
ncbi:ubiquitin carboxyl-terminal hydrolase 36-like [Daphnia pulex]|uniref:ubiquitin carboxyl-terminal hydrolase 36-like n=1 Tax=Daphnia pulex TaxID=6669 RepID=UPI001EDD45B0|nr:ubiquitin carboxyl-terminal hydrolase 36-like [Daphnia pulex]